MLLDLCEKPQATGWTASFNISLYFSDAMVQSFLGLILICTEEQNGPLALCECVCNLCALIGLSSVCREFRKTHT